MYFRKFPHVANFDFAGRLSTSGSIKLGSQRVSLSTQSFKDGIFRITARSLNWKHNLSQAGLTPPPLDKSAKGPYRLSLSRPFGLKVLGPDNQVLLSSPSGRTFGACGTRSVS